MRIGFFACALLLLPFHAAAQTGEMWEIKSQMNIPGMPAGMGGQTSRVCQGDDPERAKAADKDKEQCKVTEKKNTATRTQITMVCKSGTMTVDQTYNAARTEFKGVMKMASKDGDMTINTTGRKVGTCDMAQQKREQDAKVDAAKKQVAAGQAQGAAAMKQMEEQQIKQCATAVDKMSYSGLGMYGHCYRKTNDKDCTRFMDPKNQMSPAVGKSCNANVVEFCNRLQTANGYMKTQDQVESAAGMCGLSTKAIKASICPRAEKDGSLGFLGAHCPVQAKPLAEVHCVGREYTSRAGGKYNAFCMNYLANADFENTGKQRPAEDRGTAASSQPSQSAQPAQPASTGDQVKQGVSKGIDKLKGLFGR
jgi:hypothetical protein